MSIDTGLIVSLILLGAGLFGSGVYFGSWISRKTMTDWADDREEI